MKQKIEPVVIKCYSDIQKAILPFKKKIIKNSVVVNGDIEWIEEDENGKNVARKVNVSANNDDISMKDLLIEGFEQIKEEIKMWNEIREALLEDEYAPNLPSFDINKKYMPVDKLINDRLGGKREGFLVTWSINNKKYTFDPYSGNLEESK
jgi:hypothetical protein